MDAVTAPGLDAVRLDVWLDVSCLFRTRSEAKRACEGGKVDVNGQPGKPHRFVRPGDEVVISRPLGRRQTVVVRALAERSIPKADARQHAEDARRAEESAPQHPRCRTQQRQSSTVSNQGRMST